MYTDISTTSYPKTLIIRNTLGGMIWQIYHVHNEEEVKILAANAYSKGFQAITLEDKTDDIETFLGWREECSDDLKAVLS